MPELGPYGSVRGARGNSRPYRESLVSGPSGPLLTRSVYATQLQRSFRARAPALTCARTDVRTGTNISLNATKHG
jgi:hypothetical protein